MVLEALSGLSLRDCLKAIGIEAEESASKASLQERLLGSLARVVGPAASVSFELGRESFYFRGRYLKLSRRMPQSPWLIDGERKGDSSVEELITGPAAQLFGSSECKFHAEGREDIDVRMLGAGRPFVIEVKNARQTSPTGDELAAKVNEAAGGDISVQRVNSCPASDMARLQRDAETHRKTYVCVCWCLRPIRPEDAEALAQKGAFEVFQKTPVRVLHRRALATRPRTVHWLQAEVINTHYFKLRVCAQAGMYIKEFVHGDLGRTRPSMRSLLGSQVEILQLDVEGLEDEELLKDEAKGSAEVQEAGDD
eukprot:TRINITY_DN4199_c2_g2_i1.p1 TRINITY_DN4199_c2_g2~~TRINITY_DN4199_c2_g2_i1.p1  ORF type:complete len:322 (+),score=75.04 TRINITY_DN4199_c2_g2_i1:37-966(+)